MAGAGADIWVCGQCRSVNKLRAKQCYNCRTPQQLAAVNPADITATGHGTLREVALPPFSSSRGPAMLASLLILLVAGLNVISTVVSSSVLVALLDDPDIPVETIEPDLVAAGSIGIATLGVALLALTAWAYWLSRAVTAMPALGLGYPAANSLMAFVENFLPGLNLLRVPAIVRDVVRRLEPTEGRGDALIFAAWIGLIAGFFLPRLGSIFNLFGAETVEGYVRNQIAVAGISSGLAAVGAVFLVGLIWWIEGRIARRRAEQLEGTATTTPAGAVAAPQQPPTPEPRVSTPVGVPTPFSPAAAPFAPPRQTAPTPEPTMPAAPFAPTPSASPSASAPATVAGPLGAVAASVASDAFHRPITAATGPGTPPVLADATVARPADEQAHIERFADARPAWNAEPPPAEPAEAAHVPTGPRLHLRVDSGTSIMATLEGESEAMSLEEVRAAAQALAKADGSVVIATAGTTFEARSLAEAAVQAFTDAGVPATQAD